MANVPFRMSGDARKLPVVSLATRTENRPPVTGVMCRNGPHCRKLQEGMCHYNHDFSIMTTNGTNSQNGNGSKKSLSVESPAFTPKVTNAQPIKAIGISPKAAAAASFTPRIAGAVSPAIAPASKETPPDMATQPNVQQAQQFHEFIPGQTFLTSQAVEQQPHIQTHLNAFGDGFIPQPSLSGLDGAPTQMNPYAHSATAVNPQSFFHDGSSFKHPLNYHLYSSFGPRRDNLMAYQRSTTDFFIPDDIREDLQMKSEAALQTFATSTLPQSVEYFHSLVALDTTNQKGSSFFGYPSWIYKATSGRDGNVYALRRIEGFRLASEASVRTIQSWKRITNASIVQIHDAFTGRWFGDSSLIVVTDFHPRSQTLIEKYFAPSRHMPRTGNQVVSETELWGLLIQLASAIKAAHENGLAVQTVTLSKILATSKNRVRISSCGIFDITLYEQRRALSELQRSDLQDLGRVILALATRNQTAHQTAYKALELVGRTYSDRLKTCLTWLLSPPTASSDAGQSSDTMAEYNVHTLLNNIADKVVSTLDSALHHEDDLTSNLMRELENGRLVRLMTKLNVVLERPDTSSTPVASTVPALLNQPTAAWSETGERYYLKLFRDYVFHQVDHDGRPVLDLGHILTCLNKLDAGIDEKIQLVSRDEQHVFISSFKEIKRGFEAAWAEISKASSTVRR